MHRNYESIERLANDVDYNISTIQVIEHELYGFIFGSVKSLNVFEIMKFKKEYIEKNIAGSEIYKYVRCNEFDTIQINDITELNKYYLKYLVNEN